MRWSATCARIALVTCLLEKLASQAGTEFADFVGLLSLFWTQRTSSLANLLVGQYSGRLAYGRGCSFLDDRFGVLG